MGEDGQGRGAPSGRRHREARQGARLIEGVLLDVGNTLLYLDYARLVRVFEREGVLPTGVFGVSQAALAERRARVPLSRWLGEGHSTEDPRSFRFYVDLALRELGAGEISESAFAALCAEHRAENFFSVPAPGALEAVTELARRFRVGVVSNAGGKVARKLASSGFGPHLLTVVDSGLEGVEKPDPRIFLRGCERIGVSPGRAVYVGDLHTVDVVGARGAGMSAWLLDPAGAWAEAALPGVDLVRDVASLCRLLLSRT